MARALDFDKQVRAFGELSRRRALDVVVIAGLEVTRSVVEGSELTGAPGQPVDRGDLRKSWIFAPRPDGFELTTNFDYAPFIEAGGNSRGPFAPPPTGTRTRNGRLVSSQVGGFHSVKLTASGWSRILAFAVARATGGRV